jgi:hypothetical protein
VICKGAPQGVVETLFSIFLFSNSSKVEGCVEPLQGFRVSLKLPIQAITAIADRAHCHGRLTRRSYRDEVDVMASPTNSLVNPPSLVPAVFTLTYEERAHAAAILGRRSTR